MPMPDEIMVPTIHGLVDGRYYEEIIKYVQAGGEKDVRNSRGQTPLMSAASAGKIALFKLLLDLGFSTEGTDNFG